MSLVAAELIARVGADVSDFERGMKQAHAGVQGFVRNVEDVGKRATDVFTSLGRSITQGFGMGIGIQAANDFGQALERAVGGAVGFQQELIRIQNNTTMTSTDVAVMRDGILKLGAETGASFTSLGQGFMHITNITGDTTSAMAILTAATESAVSTGGNAATTARVLANAMHEYGLDTSAAIDPTQKLAEVTANAAHVMGVMHLAAASGGLTLEQFSEDAGTSIGVAANLGISLEQVAAAYVSLTKHGYDSARANTQITDAMIHMFAPTKQSRDELQRLSTLTGVDLVHDFGAGGLSAAGFTGILDHLHQAFTKLGLSPAQVAAEMNKLVPALRGGLGMMALTGTAAQDYTTILDTLTDRTQTDAQAAEALARTQETVAFQFTKLKREAEAALLVISGAFAPLFPTLKNAVSAFGELLDTGKLERWAAAVSGGLQSILDHLAPIGEAFGRAFAKLDQGDFAGALGGILQTAADFAGQFFTAGVNIVASFAQGIVEAAATVLMDAVNAVTSLIASFFIGNSPPPVGPLSRIAEGGQRLMEAYVGGMRQAAASVGDVASAVAGPLLDPNVAAHAASERGDRASTRSGSPASAGAGPTTSIDTAISVNKANIEAIRAAQEQIKASYEGQLAPLQAQIDLLQHGDDLTNRMVNDQDQLTAIKLKQQEIDAQGDPRQRATLEADMAGIAVKERDIRLTQDQTNLQRQLDHVHGIDSPQAQLIRLRMQSNADQLKLDTMGDPALLAQIQVQEHIQAAMTGEHQMQQQIAKLQHDMLAIPLEEKVKALTAEEKAKLAVLDAQLKNLEAQGRQLGANKGGGLGVGVGTGTGHDPATTVKGPMVKAVEDAIEAARTAGKVAMDKLLSDLDGRAKAFGTSIPLAIEGAFRRIDIGGLLFGKDVGPAHPGALPEHIAGIFEGLAPKLTKWLGDEWAKVDWAAVWKSVTTMGDAMVKNLTSITKSLEEWESKQLAAIDWNKVQTDAGVAVAFVGGWVKALTDVDTKPLADAIASFLVRTAIQVGPMSASTIIAESLIGELDKSIKEKGPAATAGAIKDWLLGAAAAVEKLDALHIIGTALAEAVVGAFVDGLKKHNPLDIIRDWFGPTDSSHGFPHVPPPPASGAPPEPPVTRPYNPAIDPPPHDPHGSITSGRIAALRPYSQLAGGGGGNVHIAIASGAIMITGAGASMSKEQVLAASYAALEEALRTYTPLVTPGAPLTTPGNTY